jgi:uncharacterized surface protein with fasciclin (FAS1) repeats
MLNAKLFATPLFAMTALGAASFSPAYAQEETVEAAAPADTATPAEDAATADATTPVDVAAPAEVAAPAITGIAAEISAESTDHNTLATALAKTGVAEKLSSEGPFTVFAPTDAAFAAVPQPMTDWLMAPDNSDALAKVLTFHVVPGRITAEDIYAKIKAGGGKATLTTVEGETLTFTEVQGNIKVEGTQGSTGFVTQQDVEQSNGMIQVINGVLMPTLG